MDHEGEDTHLCSAAIVELDGGLLRFSLSRPTEDVHVFLARSSNLRLGIVSEAIFECANKDDKLNESRERNRVWTEKTGESGVNLFEIRRKISQILT